MKNILSLTFAALVLSASSCATQAGTTTVSRNMEVNNFTEIDLTGPMNVIYQASSKPHIKIDGPDKAVAQLEIEVKGSQLIISCKDRNGHSWNDDIDDVTIYAYSPRADKFTITGSGNIHVNSDINTGGEAQFKILGSGDMYASNVKAGNVKATVNGSGDLYLDLVDAGSITATVNGSGDLTIQQANASNEFVTSVSGSGDITISSASSKDASTTVNGSGDMLIESLKTSSFTCSVNGNGDLECESLQAINAAASIAGSGDITLAGRSGSAGYNVVNSGWIDAADLIVDNVSANVTGSGTIECTANATLKANVSGSGEIEYSGNPKLSASGKVENIYKE